MCLGNGYYAVMLTFYTSPMFQIAAKRQVWFVIRRIRFTLCHYLVEFYRSDDRMAHSKVQNDEKCI